MMYCFLNKLHMFEKTDDVLISKQISQSLMYQVQVRWIKAQSVLHEVEGVIT